MSDPDFTLLWAKLVLNEIVRSGVQHVCIAPGSRSTPLVMVADALRNKQQVCVHTHFDERGLGFYALGLAKKTQQPVAIIVTSGTAVANLLPAVTEAFLTKEKLILLTADRPIELVGCGANQAIQQKGIFSSHVTDAVFLPTPSMNTPAAWVLSRVDEALFKQQQRLGPIQINCPYATPFYSGDYEAKFPEYLLRLEEWLLDNQPYVTHTLPSILCDQQVPSDVWNKKGMILVGAIGHEEQIAVKAFALATGWPILADVQSGIVTDWVGYDIWLSMQGVQQKLESLDVVIQFGTRFVSPSIESTLKDKPNLDYFLIDEVDENKDPSYRRVNYIHSSPMDWIKAQSFEAYSQCKYSGWGDRLKYYARKMLSYIEDDSSDEIALVQKTDTLLSPDSTLFLGNSTLIRLFNNFAIHSHPNVYANRGASGIDGLIATAAGVVGGCRHSNQAMCAMVGDLSALHDLNSLALLCKIDRPFILVISNNAGGAIFDRFPIAPHMQDLYQMYHAFNFEHAAAMFGIDYMKIDSIDVYEEAFRQASEKKKATIIEYTTQPKVTDLAVKKISNKLKTMEKLTLVKE